MKKIIATVAAICVAAMSMPLQAAVFAEGETQIETADDFKAWLTEGMQDSGAVLTEDIDLEDEPLTPGSVLSNTLDGGGHKISGLNIDNPDGQGALFSEIGTTGIIKNLTIEGGVSADEAAGIAVTNNGNITNVKTEITVFGHGKAAGIALTNNGTISGSDNTGDVSITDDNSLIAGIACENTSEITGCANYGDINGRISNGGAEFAGGICAFSDNTGSITGCANTGTVSGVDLKYTDTVNNDVSDATDIGGAGGIAGVSEGTIDGSMNSGFINGNGYINIGGIAGFCAAAVTDSSNYGEVSSYAHNDDALDTSVSVDEAEVAATGGMVGLAKANVESAANYGSILGESRNGGIVGAVAGTASEIKDSANYGRIDGSHMQGGIAGEANGAINDCANYGEIHGSKSYTGGVVGRLRTGAMELCANNGVVSGAESNEPSDNYTGGVVGRADENNTPITNVYNTVEISAPYGGNGGLGCKLNTNIIGFVINLGSRNIDGGKSNKNFDSNKVFWRDSDWGENWPADITAQLNAAGGDVWVDGPDGYPVFKKDAQPADGKIHVKTAEALTDALADENDADIIIDGIIETIGDIPVNGTKTLSGGRLILTGGSLTAGADSALTLGNISIQTSSADDAAAAVKVNGGSLIINGIVDTNSSIAGESGMIDLTGIWCDSAENTDNPSITAADGMFVPNRQYSKRETSYYMYVPESADVVTGITAFAADNAPLQFDVRAYIGGNKAVLFMPGTADLTSVTFKGVNDNGEAVTGNEWTEDLSEGNTVENVRIGGFNYTVSAMQSDLPTLSFNIDEQYGTINAMNTSVDHSVKCYGDVNG